MKLKLSAVHAIVFVFLSLFLASCSKTYDIGISLPLSGPEADSGKHMLRGIEIYADQLNKSGGINGHKLNLVIKDDKDDPELAKKNADEFAADKNIIGVVGHDNSPALIASGGIYDKNNIVCITPMTTNPDVVHKSEWTFMINSGGVYQGEFMSYYIKAALNKTNPLIILQESRYGERHLKGFEGKADKLGIKIAGVIKFKNKDLEDEKYIEKQFNNLTKTAFDSIVIFSDYNRDIGRNLLKQIRKSSNYDLKHAVMFAPESFISSKYTDASMQEFTRDFYVCSPFFFEMSNSLSRSLKETYMKKFREFPSFKSAMAYDAVLLMAEAIKEKGTDRKAVREFLMEQKRKNLQKKKKDTVVGGTGELLFLDDRTMDRDIYVAEIRDGRYKIAFTQLATVKEPYVTASLPERIKQGYVVELDGTPFHLVDTVFVGLDVIRINNVNTKDMKFESEFFVWYKWQGKHVDTNQIEPANGTGDLKLVFLKENLKHETKYRAYRGKSTFNAVMDFKDFPQDSQSFIMTFSNKSKNNTHINLIPDERHMTHEKLKNLPFDWHFITKENYTGLLKYDSTFGDPEYRLGLGYKSRILFSTVNFDVQVSRVITGFAITVLIPLLVILLMTVMIVLVPPEELKTRLPLVVTAMLTVVLSRMALSASMPVVGYVMKADYIFMFAFVYVLCTLIMLTVVVWAFTRKKEELGKTVHKWFIRAFMPLTAAAYVLIFLL